MNKLSKKSFVLILLTGIVLSGCRKDPEPIPEQRDAIFQGDPSAPIKGFYLINEGNMNMNKASLDYVDFTTGIYRRNIYNQANPEITKGLGDVANDIGIYGSKMYIIVNVSNKIEVLDVKSSKKIGQIDLINCRYITFHGGKAYVSAYLGKVGDPASPQGIVAEIDTATLSISRRVDVGRQPEEMAVVNEKLYVANSGGYTPTNYERTVSVIDLPTFTETKRIDVGINLHRLKADRFGDLYVTSRGDYLNTPSRLFVINTQTGEVKKTINVPASNLWIDDDRAYIYSTEFNHTTGNNTIKYSMIDVNTETILNTPFITDGTDKKIVIPYGIMVHPVTKDIYVTDAKDYVTPGVLYCFDKNGKKKWQAETGDIPAGFALVYK